jgi:glutamate 5-kinase
VLIVDEHDRSLAHGLTNYSSAELERIRGCRSAEIIAILGYTYGDEAVHRDNLVLVNAREVSS